MKLTRADVELACRTPKGGARTELALHLGEDPKFTGWMQRMVGRDIDERAFSQICARTAMDSKPHARNTPGQTQLFAI